MWSQIFYSLFCSVLFIGILHFVKQSLESFGITPLSLPSKPKSKEKELIQYRELLEEIKKIKPNNPSSETENITMHIVDKELDDFINSL